MGSIRRWRTIAVLFYAGVLTLSVSCRNDKPREDTKQPKSPVAACPPGGVYRKALLNEPATLDPAFVTDTYEISIVQQLFDGLVQFDASLNVIPSIAKAWSASHDGLSWTFHLREGVKFHHGREVTAEDVVYAFTRLLDPKMQSPSRWLLERVQGAQPFLAGESAQVEGLQTIDRYTLHITLSQPYAPFVSMLGVAQLKVVPREEVERPGMQQFGRQPVGTGPFRLVDWVAGKEIHLQANSAYFEGRPCLDRVQYRLFSGHNVQAVLAEFEKGHLEDTAIPTSERQRLKDDPRYRFVRKPLLATLLLWINTREAPLDNLAVRQAINHAINRAVLNSTIRQNRFVQARGILPQGMPGYNPATEVEYAYDLARARQLLQEAGYPEGKGLPPLELWNGIISQDSVAEHEAIQHDLQQVGITVTLHTAENWKRYTELLGKRPGTISRYAWFADFPDPDHVLFPLFHSQGPNNFANYSNPQVDQLLEDARREVDYLKRMQLYRQAEALVMADAPTVNLLYYTFEQLFQPYVQGIELNALGDPYIPMKKIWLEKRHHGSSIVAKP